MKIHKLEKIIYFIKSKLVSKNFWIPLIVSFTLGLALKYILMIWGINIFEQPFHFATLSALGIIAFIRQLCAVYLQSNTGELITLHMESGASAGGASSVPVASSSGSGSAPIASGSGSGSAPIDTVSEDNSSDSIQEYNRFGKVMKDACQEILANNSKKTNVSVRELYLHINSKGLEGDKVYTVLEKFAQEYNRGEKKTKAFCEKCVNALNSDLDRPGVKKRIGKLIIYSDPNSPSPSAVRNKIVDQLALNWEVKKVDIKDLID